MTQKGSTAREARHGGIEGVMAVHPPEGRQNLVAGVEYRRRVVEHDDTLKGKWMGALLRVVTHAKRASDGRGGRAAWIFIDSDAPTVNQ